MTNDEPIEWDFLAAQPKTLAIVALEMGTTEADLTARAAAEWKAEGRPSLHAPLSAERQATNDRLLWSIVCWWLRRSPAIEITHPERLISSMHSYGIEGDLGRCLACVEQVIRIALDDEAHPLNALALRLYLDLFPSPRRSELAVLMASTKIARDARRAPQRAH